MVLCCFLPPELGNFTNFPVCAKGKIRLSNPLLLQVLLRFCLCKSKQNSSRLTEITAEFRGGRMRGPVRPTERLEAAEDVVDE